MPTPPGLVIASKHDLRRLPQIWDNFDRPDSAVSLGTSTSGHVWSALVGTWGTIGQAAYLVTDAGEDVALLDSGMANCLIQVQLNPAGAASHRLLFRGTDASNYWLLQTEFGVYKIYQRVAGGFTGALASFAKTQTDGDVITIWMAGNQVEAYINGYHVMSANSSHNATATKHGIGGANNTGAGSRWRDFAIWAA